ncbi:MAG: histidine kinase [Eubacteriales bacterium]|nr:histidine kinase [Eubacteriales bacterium]
MIYAILDNLMIMLLTGLGMFFTKEPVMMIVVAAVLMVMTTYRSLEEEHEKWIQIIYGIILLMFAILSGNVSGFLIFLLYKELKLLYRCAMGTIIFFACQVLFHQGTSVAMVILQTICLMAGYTVLSLIMIGMTRMEQRKVREGQRIVASNISELHEKRLNEQLVKQRYMDEKNARLLERENISRNIHNSVGHSITAAIMTLDAADLLYDVKPDEARKKMNDANTRIRGSLESIRRAVRVLDEANVALTAGELKAELEMIGSEFVMDTSMEIRQNFDDVPDDIKLPHDHVVFLTGVLQEMLTNGVKHGKADTFVVVLTGDSAHIRLDIADNGASDFQDSNAEQRIENGFGIKKIISYVEKCGGKTHFANDHGFKSMVELPIVFGG